MFDLATIFHNLQRQLFPALTDELGELSALDRQFYEALRARPTLCRLCGWESANEVPSEATFSRAFATFAEDQLPQRIHENMVKTHAGPKLVGHVSRDATAIEAPERLTPKPSPTPRLPRKRGRPKKGEVRPLPLRPSGWTSHRRGR